MRQNRKNRGKKKNNWLKESLEYIVESRNYIYAIILIFAFSIIIGFFLIPLSPELSNIINNELKGIIDITENLSGTQLIGFILWNNAKVSAEGLFSPLIIIDAIARGANVTSAVSLLIFVPVGYLIGAIQPILSIANGAILGYVLSKVFALSGFTEFWRILPHGIFELPAVFISLGMGMKLGTFLFNSNPGRELKIRFIKSIKTFVCVVIPLLIIAAVIEGTLITFLK
jgi:uncharacterized membrane protein SpoIIM required for sporulation